MDKITEKILSDKKELKDRGMFVVDTVKVLETALAAGCELLEFYYCEGAEGMVEAFAHLRDVSCRVKRHVIDKFASVKTHSNFIAVFRTEPREADTVNAKCVVVLDTVQDPSNVGAIIRNGAAFGFNDYLLIDCAYQLSEKAIRASSGAVFFAAVTHIKKEQAQELLKGRQVMAAESKGGLDVREAVKKIKGCRIALVMGSEGRGVSAQLLQITDMRVKISHVNENVESLNVASAAAVIMHELAGI